MGDAGDHAGADTGSLVMDDRITRRVDELITRFLHHTAADSMTWTRETIRGERFYYGTARGVVYVYSNRLEIFNQRGVKVWEAKGRPDVAELFDLIRGRQDERTEKVVQAILDDLDRIDPPK